MKRLLVLALFATSLHAHPSVSVVIDSRGYVYYSDLEQVWRVAPNGDRTIAVPNVHTHELYLDPNDNLYGEHLWYNGERLNTWGSRVWRRSPDGRMVDVVPAHAGFNDKYGFVRDRAGNMYVADRTNKTILRCAQRCADFAKYPFRDIRWMTVTPDGVVYLIDTVDLLRIDAGKVTTLARNLSVNSAIRPWAGDRHKLMGLWTDRAGMVYVADYSQGEVKRIDARGKVTTFTKSPYPWAPTGGAFAVNGDLWLLEYRMNGARLRKVGK
jgi:sugar lactone lactonase YvrE